MLIRALLYWTDWGDNSSVQPHIERAYFDGSQRRTVITFDLGVFPLGITVDKSNGLLYWATSNGIIGRCNYKGKRKRIIYTSDTVNTDGITIVGDYIYWIDKTSGSMWRGSKTNASDARQVLQGLTQLRGISSADMVEHSGKLWPTCTLKRGTHSSHFLQLLVNVSLIIITALTCASLIVVIVQDVLVLPA